MDLEKIKLHNCLEKGKAASQITLDDDYNVPDYRPDIVKVLKEKGELHFDEVKAAAGAVWVKGKMVFRVLYRSDQENGKISCLRGEIPFQEKLNMDGILEYDNVWADGEIEDLTIGVIHSRKISVRAVIVLRVWADMDVEMEICSGVLEECGCEQKNKRAKTLELLFSKKDICRQKSEIVLPSSKPNVQEILWKSMELRNVGTHLSEKGVTITGEVLLSVLYSEEEEIGRIQWYETVVPLECSAECDAGEGLSQEELVYKIKVGLNSAELEVKPDYDGEERMLVMELVLGVSIRVWRETTLNILEDLYSLKRKMIPVRENAVLENMLVKNEAQCRLTERMELSEEQEKILQICSCEGNAHVERTQLLENGMQVEGILTVELLYVTTEDNMPVGVLKEIYPFEQLVEIPKPQNHIKTELECSISQLSAIMLDQENVEVKAVIAIDLLAFEEEEISNIVDVEEEPLDMEELRKRPGLIGYIAKDGDEIWDIAKENHTTIAEILKNNGRKEEALKRGEKILIVKSVE